MVETIDLSRLSDHDIQEIMGGTDYDYFRAIREAHEELADTISTLSFIRRDPYPERTPDEMVEVDEEGIAALNEVLKKLNIGKEF